jgi:hypothetical protein
MANGLYSTPQINPYPQSEFLDGGTKRPTRAWQQFFLNMVNFSSSDSATTESGGPSLPANPVGFINITVNGQPFKVPYYNQ